MTKPGAKETTKEKIIDFLNNKINSFLVRTHKPAKDSKAYTELSTPERKLLQDLCALVSRDDMSALTDRVTKENISGHVLGEVLVHYARADHALGAKTLLSLSCTIDPVKKEEALFSAAIKGHLSSVKELIRPSRFTGRLSCSTLSQAAIAGQLHVVQFLEPFYGRERKEDSFVHASQQGHIDVVSFLLPFVKNKKDIARAFYLSAENGKIDVVQFLKPHYIYRPEDQHDASFALCRIAAKGHRDTLPLILPFADPKFQKSRALAHACAQNHQDIFDILYPLSSPEDALFTLSGWYADNSNEADMLLKRMKIDETKSLLRKEVGETIDTKPKARKRHM